MSESNIREFWKFDDADLSANRLGQLTEKQKSYLTGEHKSQKNVSFGVGLVMVLLFLGIPLGILLSSGVLSNSGLLEGFSLVSLSKFILPVIAFVVIIVIYAARGSKSADLVVKSAKGKVSYTWGTKRVRTPGNSASKYKDVRVRHLNLGDRKFEVHEELSEMIKEGEDWAVYYTSYPFKFLSAEKI